MLKITTNKVKYSCLFLILTISFWRSPFIFLNGRFIGEEATHHLLFALQNSFFSNLIYYDKFAGYYNLIPNLLTEIATKVPLEFSPIITVYGSFLFIILLPYLCLFRESNFLDNDYKKILASFILFLSPPFVSELWVNSLNVQIYLCLIAVLILFMNNLSSKQKIFNHILIFFGSLSGIYTCALAPFYFFKFISKKNRYNFYNFLILLISNILQLSLILKAKINNTLDSTVLSNDITFELFVNFFYNVFAKAIFARQLTHLIWDKLNLFFNNDFLLFFLSLGLITLIIILFNYKKIYFTLINDKILINLILIFLLITFIVIFGGLGNYIGGRYAAIPGSMIILIILQLSFIIRRVFLRTIFLTLIIFSISTGFYEFRSPTKDVKHQYIKFLDCINCPIWKDEVKKWRKNKDHIIRIWPYPKKNLVLGDVKIN